jgi:hypothetical protein
MQETKFRGVQHEPGRRYFGGLPRPATVPANVNSLADERMAGLAQMNANLVRAPRFQATRHESCTFQVFEGLHVGDRPLALHATTLPSGHGLDGTAETVSPIGHDMALVRGRAQVPVDQREVPTVNRVGAKLSCKALLREPGSREHQETAGFLVDAMNHAQGHGTHASALARGRRFFEIFPHQFVHGGFFRRDFGPRIAGSSVGHAANARWLHSHDHMRIQMMNRIPSEPWPRARPGRRQIHDDLHAGPQLPGGFRHDATIGGDFSPSNPISGFSPGNAEKLPNDGIDGMAPKVVRHPGGTARRGSRRRR